MSGLIYHRSEPQQKKSTYGEFDTLDFDISVGEDRVLVKNSVRLVADLLVSDAGNRVANDKIHYDPRAGAHAFVDSIQVEMAGGAGGAGGQKENIQNYGRFVVAHDAATRCPEDALNASSVCELRGFDNFTAALFSRGKNSNTAGAGGTDIIEDKDFAIKLMCCLNKMSGADLPFEKSGVIRVSVNLAPNQSALMGNDYNAAEDSYTISKPRLTYQSLPAPKQAGQTLMRTVYNTKNSIQSNFAAVQVRAPVVADAVSVVFQKQSEEQTSPHSNYKLAKPININRIEFAFNGNNNEYITYPIEDLGEMNRRFIQSFVDTGHNRIAGDRKDNNTSFGVGISFDSLIDLSNQTFQVSVQSSADNTNSYNIYQYFHSILAV